MVRLDAGGRRETSDGTNWLGGYQAYTPALAGPNFGTGATMLGRYRQDGQMVHAYGSITVGTSPVNGSGAYNLSFPVAAKNTAGLFATVGEGWYFQNSSGKFWSFVLQQSGGIVVWRRGDGTSSILGGSTPVGLTAGDIISWNLTYEAAA